MNKFNKKNKNQKMIVNAMMRFLQDLKVTLNPKLWKKLSKNLQILKMKIINYLDLLIL